MKTHLRYGFAFLALSGALSGCKPAAAPPKTAPVITEPTVVVQAAQIGDLTQTVPVTGSLIPIQDVSLSAKQGGRLSEILVREGDTVSAGQILARVDPTDLISQVHADEALVASDNAKVAQAQAAFDQQLSDTNATISSARFTLDQQIQTSKSQVLSAQSQLASAKENLSTTLEGARPQERIQTQAALASAQASYDKSQSDLKRYTRLHDAGAISDSDLDQYVSARNVALANLNSAKAALALQQEGNRTQDINRAKESVRQAEEALRQAIAAQNTDQVRRADLETAIAARKQNNVKYADILAAKATLQADTNTLAIAKKAVADTVIVAPISGQVSQRSAEVGQIVTSATVLLHVVSMGSLYFEPSVPDSAFASIRIGDTVDIRVDAYPSKVFEGTIAKIYPEGSLTSRTIPLRIVLPNQQGLLRANMFAQGKIVTVRHHDVPLIPSSSVQTKGGQSTVFYVEGGTVRQQPVTLGLTSDDGTTVEVHGLGADAQVVVSDSTGLKPGEKVKAATAPKAGA